MVPCGRQAEAMQINRHRWVPHTQAPHAFAPAAAADAAGAAASTAGTWCQHGASSSSSHIEPQGVQQQVLWGCRSRVELPVGAIQHKRCRHPAAVVAAGAIVARLAANGKILQVEHQHLLLWLF